MSTHATHPRRGGLPRPGRRFHDDVSGQPSGGYYHPGSYQKMRRSLRPAKPTVVSVLGELLVTAGVFLLLFVVWELYWTNLDANRQADAHQQQVIDDFQRNYDGMFTGDGPDPAVPAEVGDGAEAWGILYVPRLGSDWSSPVLDGVSPEVIDQGVLGRYPDSPRPGEEGNLAMAAHRQTHGSILWDMDQVVEGDRMYLQTANGWWVYEVKQNHIVLPTAIEVLDPNPLDPGGPASGQWLTITTCHPLYTTRERMVTHAEKVEFVPLADGPPEEIAEVAAESMPAGATTIDPDLEETMHELAPVTMENLYEKYHATQTQRETETAEAAAR
ncbi:class E sortase [Auritidibacter ignavus]|uniref:class E sortase n=1 Tax=Auritidibacter TaxID=1160973 RepID=UPI000D73748C|nr:MULTISPECIES: class E sortase [Auritidibacter]PXA77302.1 hypothetical protein DCC26_08485 [Auritidibacter sp. NML120779]AXR74430.1 class E sortase [Auritidibacter sp. NML130574]PXA79331.1 hypothetical protein DCC25_09335 [Auritidibacter sp. NML120636]WGH80942.1 class E sortase [Auritidibacter ignavus]WGH85546.1 class E sortase [Auritidibacter ignavus]